jgi:hypothetical protein
VEVAFVGVLRAPAVDLDFDLFCEFAAEVIDVDSGPAVDVGGYSRVNRPTRKGEGLLADPGGDAGAGHVCLPGVEHVFEPVVAVGSLLRDPVDLRVGHAAVPVGPEAENVAIELVFCGAGVDEEADVDDVMAHFIRHCGRLCSG